MATDPTLPDEHLDIDAPLATKGLFHTDGVPAVSDIGPGDTPVPGDPVRFPGDAAANATGSRAPTPGGHNWIPVGPRNVGGRVTALAVDPTNASIMYAGGASGGVFKTLDAGQSWFPLWQDEASLPVGAIAISPSAAQTVWAATGAVRTGGAEIIRGNGILRSTDGGATWVATGPPGAAPSIGFSFDALAAHPTNAAVCWAVGPAGVFRTTNGGGAWTQFVATAGTYFSDAEFSLNAAGQPILYLVRATSAAGEAIVIRLDAPNAADPAIEVALAAAANQMQVIAPAAIAPLRFPARGKIAVAPSNRNVVYVHFVRANSSDFGVFRSRNARAVPASTAAWAQLASHVDWAQEGQGLYNLSIAVSPANSNHVATGMVDLYTSTNANTPTAANVAWNRAMAWDIYHLDRGHHADHHAALFVARGAGTPELWVGNDGGISMSTDWSTGAAYVPATTSSRTTLPLPTGVTTWRKRSAGLLASQMYDLTQSPLVPTMYACGFQDNGVFVTSGGGSWRFVMGADGGFIAFDPDDPYRLLATWQTGVVSVDFAGKLDGTLPTAGDGVTRALWPRVLRQGFLAEDVPLFVADMAHDPFDGDRVLLGRQNRLYGLRRAATGDAWSIESVGSGVELLVAPIGGTSTVRVTQSAGARALGLEPQFMRQVGGNRSQVQTTTTEPFRFGEGDTLQLVVNGAAAAITFRSGNLIRDLTAASASEVAAEINRQAPAGLTAANVFKARPTAVEIQTVATSPPGGPLQSITLGGTALAAAPPGLRVAAGTYQAPPGGRAIVRIPVYDRTTNGFANVAPPAGGPPPPPPLTLTVQVGAGPVRVVTFAPPAFADPSSLRVGELVAALRTALANDGAVVEAISNNKGVVVSGTAGNLTFGGTAQVPLGLPAGPVAIGSVTFPSAVPRNLVAAPPLALTITDAAGNVAAITFNAATFANPAIVFADELNAVIANQVAAGGVNAQVDPFLFWDPGDPTEIAFSPTAPDRVWVGGMAGLIHASDDNGLTWRTIAWPAMAAQDRRVEAIAFHPSQPGTIYVGLYGERKDLATWANNPLFLGTGPADPGFLFRTTDGGTTWTHIGAGVVDNGAPPSILSINAIETDPSEPDALYVATNVGVFRSPDRGDNWVAFNEGLPNVWIRDLAFEPTTRMLRAGAWGRGVYERHVGALPASDVAVYIRANELDTGLSRPAPRGPAPFALHPDRVSMTSPDIKVTRSAPAHLTAAGAVVDGVDFDEDVDHEPPTPGDADVFVQVHNRGAFPATGVRIVAMWADATSGPPPLPDDFWLNHALGPLAGALGAWTVVGDHTIVDAANLGHDRVTADMPRVHRFHTVFPAEIAGFRAIGLLVVLTSTEDPNLAAEVDVMKLLDVERMVAYRQSTTTHPDDDHQLLLRGVDGATFSVAAAPTSSALQRLGWAAGVGPVAETLAGSEVFDLRPSVATARGIQISTPAVATNITFTVAANEFANPAAATWSEVADVLNREFVEAGVGLRASSVAIGAGNGVRIDGRGGQQLAVTGGTLQPILGLPIPAPAVPAASSLGAVAGPFALGAVGTVHTLAMQVAAQRDVRFTSPPIRDLRVSTAREVRAVVNRAMDESRIPVRAEVPRRELRVRGSVTDVQGPEPVLGGAHLAELTAQGAASIPAANRDALFHLLQALAADRVTRSANNFLYLRVTNSGNAAASAAQVRLYAATIGLPADPANVEVHVAQIGADIALDVPAGGTAVAEAQWNPGAVDAGSTVFVLAVVNPAGRPIAVPPAHQDFDAFHRFCGDRPDVAYRSFEVAP